MNSKTLVSMAVGFAVMVLLVAPTQAAGKKGEMDPEMQAMMAKAKERGTPGADHAVLKPLEGEWTVTIRHWMKPGKKHEKSIGTSSNSWILDGRFLKQKYKGEWAGQPFEGMGFMGYDNVRKEYVSVWMDSMSTGIMQGSGQYDPTTRTIKSSGTFSCPLTGEKNMWYRDELKIVNDNKVIMNMYVKDPEGKEFRSMELVYKRVKQS